MIEIPEVAAFERARDALHAFKEEHAEIIETLTALIDDYNDALTAADKAVRPTGVSVGPFTTTRKPTVKYDAQKLYEEMGADFFKAYGGTITSVPRYEIDSTRIEAARHLNAIPKEVVDATRSVVAAYKKIDRGLIP